MNGNLKNICWKTIFRALGVVLLLAETASAAMVTIDSGRDTTIYGQPPSEDNANGSGIQMFVGNNNGDPIRYARRGLVWFDVAANVPSGATITSVTLTMHLVGHPSNPASPALTNVDLHRLTADWGEAGSNAGTSSGAGNGAVAEIGDATWNSRFHHPTTPQTWATEGGDFVLTPSASLVVDKTTTGPGQAKSWSSPIMIGDAQLWLDTPALNFGWIVTPTLGDQTAQTERRFSTREGAEALFPTLTIQYTTSGSEVSPIPEPGTLGLGVCGLLGLAVTARKRRAAQLRQHQTPVRQR